MNKDDEHLKLLSIFHYVLAGMLALFGCFPIFHLGIGIFFLVAPDSTFEQPDGEFDEEVPRQLIGGLFTGIAGLMMLCMWTLAALTALAGKYLAQRRRWTYCMVVAAFCCLWAPLGTVLGVFTIIVLNRPSVKEMFDAA